MYILRLFTSLESRFKNISQIKIISIDLNFKNKKLIGHYYILKIGDIAHH